VRPDDPGRIRNYPPRTGLSGAMLTTAHGDRSLAWRSEPLGPVARKGDHRYAPKRIMSSGASKNSVSLGVTLSGDAR
jgi:hypothetical protein